VYCQLLACCCCTQDCVSDANCSSQAAADRTIIVVVSCAAAFFAVLLSAMQVLHLSIKKRMKHAAMKGVVVGTGWGISNYMQDDNNSARTGSPNSRVCSFKRSTIKACMSRRQPAQCQDVKLSLVLLVLYEQATACSISGCIRRT
jgi:hypothetical protein